MSFRKMGKVITFIPNNIEMKTITLKLSDIAALEAEINGSVDLRTGQLVKRGIMSQNLSGARKYWLKKLSDLLAKEVKFINETRDELVKKYFADKDGNVEVKQYITKKNKDGVETKEINPKFEQYDKEVRELLDIEREIEYNPIKLSELEEIKFEEYYYHVFSLVEEPAQ